MIISLLFTIAHPLTVTSLYFSSKQYKMKTPFVLTYA